MELVPWLCTVTWHWYFRTNRHQRGSSMGALHVFISCAIHFSDMEKRVGLLSSSCQPFYLQRIKFQETFLPRSQFQRGLWYFSKFNILILVIWISFPTEKAKQRSPPKTKEKPMKKPKAKHRFGDVGLSKNVFSGTSLPTIEDSTLLELVQCLYTLWLWL